MIESLAKRLRIGGRAARIRAVPDWLTLTEATAYLKVTRNTVYRWCDQGFLPFYELKVGRGRRFKREDLDALLERGVAREGTDDGSGQGSR